MFRVLLTTALLIGASGSQAAILDISFSGKLGPEGFGSVDDTTGVWDGLAVRGAAISGKFTYDTALGTTSSYPGLNGSTVSNMVGGPSYGVTNPFLAAEFTIGTKTKAVDMNSTLPNSSGVGFLNPGGVELGYIPDTYPGDFARYQVYEQGTVGGVNTSNALSIDLNTLLGVIPASFVTPYVADFDLDGYLAGNYALPNASGFVHFIKTIVPDSFPEQDVQVLEYSYLNFWADRVTVTCRDCGGGGGGGEPGAVPLPAAGWTLLAALAALTGLAKRRRAA